MQRLLAIVQGVGAAWGGLGLFLIGYLDSSFLSFPEANDLLIILLVTHHKARLLYYALMATAGSTAGCLTLYFIARKGGETFLRKRFKAHHVDGALKLFQKYGLLAVIVPALLPPPAPFKIFILLAGVAAVPVWQFTVAVATARFARYLGEGLLAVFYGEQAGAFLRAHARDASLAVAGAVLALGLGWIWWTRRRAN